MSLVSFFRHRTAYVLGIVLATIVVTAGTSCPPTGGGDIPNANPIIPVGNRPPRVFITSITTDFGNNFAEVGEPVSIAFSGDDAEDAAVVRIFASTSGNPTPAQEIPILGGFPIGPGSGSGVAVWNTAGVAPRAYNIFAEIDDRTFNPFTGTGNPPVRVTGLAPVQIGPPGSRPSTSPPQLVFLSPLVNLGLSAADELTLRYIYADVDSNATVTLLLDKDLNPANDNINNPGDPNDPNTNIIILPSAARKGTDPTFDGDPPPPDDPADPPTQPDSLEIRRNPRVMPATTPGALPFPGAPLAGEVKDYVFPIDFSSIPPRSQPYFIRASITDGNDTRQIYATGALTISAGASGIVDVTNLGFSVAGARFQGFSPGENLGTDFVAATDLEQDGVEDFMLASRYASPRNRFEVGAAYLVFGRRKTPFPVDTDGDGLPDGGVVDQNGEIVDFPEPPDFLPNPYDPINVGRFGGVISVNSISTFFRGTLYAMPFSYTFTPPPGADPAHPLATSAGLTSITRCDMSNDGVADLIFGLPFCALYESQDDDPADECSDTGLPYLGGGDVLPNADRCSEFENDDIGPVDGGVVIMVDGANDIRNTFRRFTDASVAGQFDPNGAPDDEGVIRGPNDAPQGMRFKGAWWDFDQEALFGPPTDSFNEYGRTVSAIPSIDNDLGEELLISSPGYPHGTELGRVTVWLSLTVGDGFVSENLYVDGNQSLPSYAPSCPGANATCTQGVPPICVRCFITPPVSTSIFGMQLGDRFGYAKSAGQVNNDGASDIACGSPGADRDGFVNNGVSYLIFTPAGGFGNVFVEDVPHLRITGTHDGDAFGLLQEGIQDVSGDGIPDLAIASESFDADVTGDLFEEANVGYVGVIFGDTTLTGELGFTPEEVGTPALKGIRFLGAVAGANAGRDVSAAGDFNGDGLGDFLVSSPNEIRCENTNGTFSLPVGGVCGGGQVTHRGVAYLIFGGPHLRSDVNGRANNVFNLTEVGSAQLPGIVFISRNLLGTGPETLAQIEYVGALGDVDGDGFDDIGLGAPTADFVNLTNPTQRRIDAGEVYIVYGNSFGSNDLTP